MNTVIPTSIATHISAKWRRKRPVIGGLILARAGSRVFALWDGHQQLRGGPLGELALAVPPTLTVIAVLFFVEVLTSQRTLFASLASSAFLIYREPNHAINSVRVMTGAHVAASALGVGCAFLLGAGYVAAACAMTLTILVLVLGDLVHPPAVATALGFAFYARQSEAVGVFLLALVMLAVLLVLERLALWTLARVQTARRGEYVSS